jgi:outer membrane protein assembly factor BamD
VILERLRSLALGVGVLALAGCGAASTLPRITSDADRLAVARKLHDQNKCANAIELLKTYVASAAGSAQVDEGIYLLGACYLKTKEWTLAQAEFERMLRDYPESDSSGSASFGIGESFAGQARPRDFDQEMTVRAIEQWQRYLADYPGHWRNEEARRRVFEARTRLAYKLMDTGDLYLKLRLPEPARVYFQKVVDEYGDTRVGPEAQFGVGVAYSRMGRWVDAIRIFREIETRYPGGELARLAAEQRRRLERG